MSSHQVYRINQPTVLSEIIEGEAIIINLDTGAYYSLRDTGAVVWDLIARGVSNSQIVAQMASQYEAPASEIESGVQAFIEELAAENLIVSTEVQPIRLASEERETLLPFQAPILEKYTDMADLLLLDPIHEVDELEGWPQAKPGE